jgi:hypothetical protein
MALSRSLCSAVILDDRTDALNERFAANELSRAVDDEKLVAAPTETSLRIFWYSCRRLVIFLADSIVKACMFISVRVIKSLSDLLGDKCAILNDESIKQ